MTQEEKKEKAVERLAKAADRLLDFLESSDSSEYETAEADELNEALVGVQREFGWKDLEKV